MGNFATVSALVSAQPGSISVFTRTLANNPTTQLWFDAMIANTTYLGTTELYPAAMTAPSAVAGVTLSNTSGGAIDLPNVAGGSKLYLSRVRARGGYDGGAGGFYLYDRLIHSDGLVSNVITSQTVNTVALPARATGDTEVEAFSTTWTTGGNTGQASDPTVSYTNSSGTAGRSGTIAKEGVSFGSFGVIGNMAPVYLASGDTGIQSIQSVTLATSSGSAGSWGFVLMKRLAYVPVSQSMSNSADWVDLGLVEVPTDACLSVMAVPPQVVVSSVYRGSTYLLDLEFVVG